MLVESVALLISIKVMQVNNHLVCPAQLDVHKLDSGSLNVVACWQ